MSLALKTSSRTHFEVLGLEDQVLGLGLEAYKSSKMPCPRAGDSTVFWIVKNGPLLWSFFFYFILDNARNLAENLRRQFFFFENTCALCPWSLILALSTPALGIGRVYPRKVGPWPWLRIFFFESLALAWNVGSSTPPLVLISTSRFESINFT